MIKRDEILRTQAKEALSMCCQTTCGSKQPIVDYIDHLESLIEEGTQMNDNNWMNDIRPDLKEGYVSEQIQPDYETDEDAAYSMSKLTVIIIIGCCLAFGLTACKVTPEKISAEADKLNEKIDERQAKANKEIDKAQAVGEAAKDAAETIIDNLKESAKDVIDNAKDSAKSVQEK